MLCITVFYLAKVLCVFANFSCLDLQICEK